MPKKTLRRSTLEQVQAAWESGKLNLMNANKPSPRSFGLVNAKNNTLATIPVGGHVKITGFARNLTYSQARRLMLQNGFLFNAVVSTAADDANAVGTAEETIRSTNIGKVRIDNLTFGAVVINNASHTLVDAAFNSVASGGVYKIIAKSSTSNGSAICALVKFVGSSSSGECDCTFNVESVAIDAVEDSSKSYIPYVSDYEVNTTSSGGLPFVESSYIEINDVATGGISVVISVECADGNVVETTRYLHLNNTVKYLHFTKRKLEITGHSDGN